MVSMLYDQTTKFSATSFAAAAVGGAAAGAAVGGAAVGVGPHAAMSRLRAARTPIQFHIRLIFLCRSIVLLLTSVHRMALRPVAKRLLSLLCDSSMFKCSSFHRQSASRKLWRNFKGRSRVVPQSPVQ